MQEAFLQAFRSIREFEGRSALKSWLFRIVVNTALMRLRSRRGSGEQCLDDVLARSSAPAAEQAWTEVATPQELLQRKEARELVVAKLMELPDGYRIVLLLRDIEGYEHRGDGKGPGHDRGCGQSQAAQGPSGIQDAGCARPEAVCLTGAADDPAGRSHQPQGPR